MYFRLVERLVENYTFLRTEFPLSDLLSGPELEDQSLSTQPEGRVVSVTVLNLASCHCVLIRSLVLWKR